MKKLLLGLLLPLALASLLKPDRRTQRRKTTENSVAHPTEIQSALDYRDEEEIGQEVAKQVFYEKPSNA